MACTTVDALTGEIKENGDHFYDEARSFIYVEDLKKVLAQLPQDVLASQIRIVDVTFPRIDGGDNHNIHDVKALAVTNKPIGKNVSVEGLNKEEDWFDIIGLFWPVYYHPGSVEGAVNPINNREYKGSPKYKAGNIIGQTD